MERSNIIGKRITVTDSTNSSTVGLEGTVIDETKHTITIDTKNGPRKLIKTHVTIDAEGVSVKGNRLDKQPSERIKGKHP